MLAAKSHEWEREHTASHRVAINIDDGMVHLFQVGRCTHTSTLALSSEIDQRWKMASKRGEDSAWPYLILAIDEEFGEYSMAVNDATASQSEKSDLEVKTSHFRMEKC